MELLIRFRSGRLRGLCEKALMQGFGQRKTGSGHLAILCPTCGEPTVFSGTQADCTGYKYENQENRLRKHGLKVAGKPERECVNAERQSA